jgi:hypothetical protein
VTCGWSHREGTRGQGVVESGGVLLDLDGLASFERALWAAGASHVIDELAPGLDVAQLARWETELGMALSIEARRWWTWRNGGTRELVPHAVMISLEQAIGAYRARQQHAREVAAHPQVAPDQRLGRAEFWWTNAGCRWSVRSVRR